MSANVRHIKKGDLVVALSGSFAGKTGKVLAIKQANGLAQIEGLGTVKRHTKPSQTSPKGGIVEKLRWLPVSKFQVCNESGKALGRAGWKVEGSGKTLEKTRSFKTQKTTKK